MLQGPQTNNVSVRHHLVFAVDLLSLDGISWVELRVSACQAEQHGSFQVHPQFGVQVFLLRLTRRWMLLTNVGRVGGGQFHHWCAGVAFSYFENVKVKSVRGVDEVQRARSDFDGELVVQDLAVQFPLEQLWFPGLSKTC